VKIRKAFVCFLLAALTAGPLEKMSASPAFAATVVKNGGRAAAAMGNIADYALSLCALTPHPEWDSYVRLCYEAYERAPDTRMTLYIRGTERNRAEELINISHYINNEFGYARGIYVNVYRLENGRFAMGFDSTAHQTKTRQDFYYEAETMQEALRESLPGSYAREPGWPALKNQ